MATKTIKLTPREGENSVGSELSDPILETGGLVVNQDQNQEADDRVYDVRALQNIFFEILNNGANGLKFVLQKSNKEYTGQIPANLDFEDIDPEAILAIAAAATGTVDLTGGASGSVDGITVDGIEIMSGSVPFNVSLTQTATDVAANINANTSEPNYTASAAATLITITKVKKEPFTGVVVSTTTTITTTDVNFTGGATGKSEKVIARISSEITAIRLRTRRETSPNDTTYDGVFSANQLPK